MRIFTYRTCQMLMLLPAFALIPQIDGAEKQERIVTVGGLATEIVWELGAGDQVVAVDLSSTYPPEVRNLPQVGYVRQISPEGVVSMKPDLIVASGALGPPAARQMMERLKLPVVWLPDPVEVDDFRQSVRLVAKQLKQVETGENLIKKVEGELSEAGRNAETELTETPLVLFLLEPPGIASGGMAAGQDSRADTIIRLAGGRNVVTEFSGFQPISRESLLTLNPDVILIGQSAGHGGDPASIQAMRESAVLSRVNAIHQDAVHAVPLDDLAFGPRLGEAVLRWNKHLIEWARSKQK